MIIINNTQYVYNDDAMTASLLAVSISWRDETLSNDVLCPGDIPLCIPHLCTDWTKLYYSFH